MIPFDDFRMSTDKKTSVIKMWPSRNHSTPSETFVATRNNIDVNLDGNVRWPTLYRRKVESQPRG